ncbi:MAG: hypothetical protein AB7O62_11510 [Pirellulales bacterium]
MTINTGSKHRWRWAIAGLTLFVPLATGCQIYQGGQTLPSPYYMQDDVQYFPAGPEFKLAREAAALKAAQAEDAARRRAREVQ